MGSIVSVRLTAVERFVVTGAGRKTQQGNPGSLRLSLLVFVVEG